MAVDTINLQVGKLTPIQDIKLSKSLAELSAGQVVKAIIVNRLSDNQVVLGINGQTVNAKTTRPYLTGEVLDVKIIKATDTETLLQVQPSCAPSLSKLQSALAQTLPRQWPATQLLATLQTLSQANKLPQAIQTQIHQLLSSFSTLSQLPQQFALALANSGYFFESRLLKLANDPGAVNKDFKGQLLKLISLIPTDVASKQEKMPTAYGSKDSLPLAGALPQAHHRQFANLQDQSLPQILSILQEQAGHVIARIQSSQINHLLHSPDSAINLLLELPVQVAENTELISFLLTKNSNANQAAASWSIQFAVHLSELGELQAEISLQETSICVEFHVQKESTLSLLAEQHQAFTELLQSAGMQLNGWGLHHGIKEDVINTTGIKLLDIRV